MTKYFLGIDIGGTKSHALIIDETGHAAGFGFGGNGNYEDVGWDGYQETLQTITQQALDSAGITSDQIVGAGFGIAGYDWPSERENTLKGIKTLGLDCPLEAVNDSIIGLIAGTSKGWGVGLVAGTGMNCCGRNRTGHEGRITGNGMFLGEFGGAIDIVWKALHGVAYAWTQRGPQTLLSEIFVEYAGAKSVADLLEGLQFDTYVIGTEAAPLVFETAVSGDEVAQDVIKWAGEELAGSAIGVIQQLDLQDLDFEVVLAGSIFKGGRMIMHPMKNAIRAVAPKVEFVHLTAPPVTGAAILGMEQAGFELNGVRKAIKENTSAFLNRRQ